jgi:hypothetical protein
VEQDSLVAGTDTEDVANLLARHPFYVAKDDDRALTRREIFQSGLEDWRPHRRFEAIIGLLSMPSVSATTDLSLSREARSLLSFQATAASRVSPSPDGDGFADRRPGAEVPGLPYRGRRVCMRYVARWSDGRFASIAASLASIHRAGSGQPS